MATYFAVLEWEPGALWGAFVPDLPGCISAGYTAQEARARAVRAARVWISDALANGEALPAPRAVAEIVLELDSNNVKGMPFAITTDS